jgi:hypothetical protein
MPIPRVKRVFSIMWEYDELKEVLSTRDFGLFVRLWNIEEEGNYFDAVHNRRGHGTILHMNASIEELAALAQ